MKNNTIDNQKDSSSTSSSFVGTAILAAIAASLCCITPVLALLGGIGGIASTFSWLEPFRPYLIGATVLVLGFAWYQKVKPRPAARMDCACEADEKPSFLQSKAFLGIVTVIAVALLAFPYYSAAFFPAENNNTALTVPATTTASAKIFIEGMTCSGCEQSVNHALRQTPGVLKVNASYSTGIAQVTFNKSQVDLPKLAHTVSKATGYKVTGYELINQK